MPVAVDASKTLLTGIIATTWGNRPASAGSGQIYLFTDLGASGTLMRYANSRWRTLAGQAQLASLGAAVTGIGTSETIVLQTLIPAGAWQTNDTIQTTLDIGKSGTTDAASVYIRVGTAGTTADTAITGVSPVQVLTTASRSGSLNFNIKLVSATSALKTGNSTYSNGAYTATTAPSAATTITDASANALYVSVSLISGGATDTLTAQAAQIRLITP